MHVRVGACVCLSLCAMDVYVCVSACLSVLNVHALHRKGNLKKCFKMDQTTGMIMDKVPKSPWISIENKSSLACGVTSSKQIHSHSPPKFLKILNLDI